MSFGGSNQMRLGKICLTPQKTTKKKKKKTKKRNKQKKD